MELSKEARIANIRLAKKRVQWLNEALFYVSTFEVKIVTFGKLENVGCNCKPIFHNRIEFEK